MRDQHLQKRRQLACHLLLELKRTCTQLKALTDELSGSSDAFMEKAFQEKQEEILSVANEYNNNIRRVDEITLHMTSRMNDWFDFAKNEENRMKIFYPLRFYSEQNKVNQFLKKSRKEISETIIQNRFVKQRLDSMEEKLVGYAAKKMEQEESFNMIKQLQRQKKEIVEEISYLMPTLPDTCRKEYTLEAIEEMISRLFNPESQI